MAELKREAARQGRTMSDLVESALRLLLRSQRKREKIVALPSFHSGGTLVDIADRDALSPARPFVCWYGDRAACALRAYRLALLAILRALRSSPAPRSLEMPNA